MLEEFCNVCGYNRKYAIWLLTHPLPNPAARRHVTARSATYSQTSTSCKRSRRRSVPVKWIGGFSPISALSNVAFMAPLARALFSST